MIEQINQPFPKSYSAINEASKFAGFTMASDVKTCSLLRALAASKPKGKFLELGTGTGLSTSWMLDGMDQGSTLISVDNDPSVQNIAERFLGSDPRLDLITADAGKWMEDNFQKKFDFIFADTWHGKYLLLDEVLNMLNNGGLYIVDDMLPQANWPAGHQEKANRLVAYLETRKDLYLTKQAWATGIIIGVKIG